MNDDYNIISKTSVIQMNNTLGEIKEALGKLSLEFDKQSIKNELRDKTMESLTRDMWGTDDHSPGVKTKTHDNFKELDSQKKTLMDHSIELKIMGSDINKAKGWAAAFGAITGILTNLFLGSKH